MQEHWEKQLITNFTILCLKHMDVDIDKMVSYFYKTLGDKEKEFFVSRFQICVGAAEAAREAPADIREYVLQEASRKG